MNVPAAGTGGSSSGGGNGLSHMITLSVSNYEALVNANLVDENIYYFTYEDKEEETNTWVFGGSFPITLTGGNTSNSIGTFPINLT